MTFLYILVGAALGGVIGWLLGLRKAKPVDNRVEQELRDQRAAQEAEAARLRAELTTLTASHSSALAERNNFEKALAEHKEAALQSAASALADQAKLEQELRGLQTLLSQTESNMSGARAQLTAREMTLSETRAEKGALEKRLAALQQEAAQLERANGQHASEIRLLREQLATERQQIESIQEKFRKDFEGISNKLLVESSSKFNEQSRKSLDEILSPLRENLGQFKESLEKTRVETSNHSAVLKSEIGRIGAEAANLTKALKGDVKALGNWGENILDQLLDKSGLVLDLHYRRQSSAKGSEGERRFLDVVIHLPESHHIVIDSKVSLRSYEEAVNALDDIARAASMARHIEAIRAHFKDLGKKRYHEIHGINAPDFVLMYVPIEGAFIAAMAHQPGLFAEALESNVVMITNSSLLATLRTVAHVWRMADQQKNAQDIAKRGGLLYDKFAGFLEDLEAVGKGLDGAQKAFGNARNKLSEGKGNLLFHAERLRDLGVASSKAIPADLLERAQTSHENHARQPQLEAPPALGCEPPTGK